MEFFYPNWINDFWRIQGLIHFGDKSSIESTHELLQGKDKNTNKGDLKSSTKRFDKEKIETFCNEKGIALFDTARKVCRLKDNADDNFLEILEPTDVFALLDQMPECRTIVTTGGKASEELQAYFEKKGIKVKIPKVGENIEISTTLNFQSSTLIWWRMPSTSRAYPMKLEKKAEYYRRLFNYP